MKEVNKTTVIYLNKRKFGVTVSLNRAPTPQHAHVIYEKKRVMYYANCGGGEPSFGLFPHFSIFEVWENFSIIGLLKFE